MTSASAPAAGARPVHDAESGFTLIELVVAMAIFAVFMTILLTALIGLTRGTARVQTTAVATSGVLIVFQTFDRQVRYADAINPPAEGATEMRYLEFRTPGSSFEDGVARCTQWRFVPADGRLETRQWRDTANSTPTPWATKLTDVLDGGGPGYPFALRTPAETGSSMQQLVLTIETGRAGYDDGTDITTTFIARNSTSDSAAAGPVCDPTGRRP